MRKLRDIVRLIIAILLVWLYVPHIILYLCHPKMRKIVNADMVEYKKRINLSLCNTLSFLYFVHNNSFFRVVFYHRAGPIFTCFFGWYRPGDKYFVISKTTKIGKGFHCLHSYSTIINAESIGDNFTCHHLVTIGFKNDTTSERPVIGSNVCVGAGAILLGAITVGHHVTIGAGSVVINDVPDCCVVAGNPAKVVKSLRGNVL